MRVCALERYSLMEKMGKMVTLNLHLLNCILCARFPFISVRSPVFIFHVKCRAAVMSFIQFGVATIYVIYYFNLVKYLLNLKYNAFESTVWTRTPETEREEDWERAMGGKRVREWRLQFSGIAIQIRRFLFTRNPQPRRISHRHHSLSFAKRVSLCVCACAHRERKRAKHKWVV